ncbi:response regulator receiver sensor signal transduction histidine kinase [Candidatus Vecturithrix granuli]|uniref:histidine kinase n=1 Tax=Vecturithrix granuli TaxID=1499967 RepID=A0A081C5U6_VECG1|nr:response regulator receiver sensor signal transduction histidine kinase [Candidatus Vecturithrix granuli]
MNHDVSSILVVEDNPATLSLLFNLLDEAGFEVLVSQDGENAITVATTAQPDMILLDVLMSGMDGFETCQRLKACPETKDIPVIFMTALTKTVDKVKGFELGAVDYITKPIEPEEVLMRIKTHLMLQQLQCDLQIKNRELHAALEREQELNKLKSRFISMASHEFRTPLATIRLSGNLLGRYYAKCPQAPDIERKIREELDVIDHSVTQMTVTLDEVLTLSTSEAGKMTFSPVSFDLREFCQTIMTRFTLIAAKTHRLIFQSANKHLQIVADPKLLDQILSNLLSNAMKYSPQGSTILCQLTEHERQAIVSVKDEGMGISAEDQQHLFEPFRRGTNVKHIQGTGLGLSIVKQFVELHGGTITVESQIEVGTTFFITLPLRKEGA